MADFDSEFFIDYSSLDDFQRQLIDRKNNKSIVVSGSAGSGKSLIALHKAKQIAAETAVKPVLPPSSIPTLLST